MNVVPTSVASCQEGFFKGQIFVDSGITSVVPFVLLSYLPCARRPGGLCPDSRPQVTLGRSGCGRPAKAAWLGHTSASIQLPATAQQGQSVVFGLPPAGD